MSSETPSKPDTAHPPRKVARWKRNTGYVAFVLFALFTGFFLSFPYEALKKRIEAEAGAMGLDLSIGSMGPGFFGVSAKNVRISQKATAPEAPAPTPLVLKSVRLRPSLFPLGLSVKADTLGGGVAAVVGGLSSTSVRVELDELKLADEGVKSLTGVDLEGTLSGELDLQLPRGTGKNTEPDLSQATGTVKLQVAAMTVKGGTVRIKIPPYPDPTPFDLPRIAVGEVDARLKFDKGAGTVEALSLKGSDLEVRGSGALKLAKRLEYSEPNMEIRLKLEPGFQKNLGAIAIGLTALQIDPKEPTFRMGKLTGLLGTPNFR